MNQGDESPLFCRDDTPPLSGVPPGYVSIRPLLLQRQQLASIQHVQRGAEFENKDLHSPGETDAPVEADGGTSSALVDLNNAPGGHAVDASPFAAEGDFAQYTSLSVIHDRSPSQSHDETRDAVLDESQVSSHDIFSGSLDPSGEESEQTVEIEAGDVGYEGPLFCREDTPPRSGVPPGYQSLRSVVGRRARRSRSPMAQRLPDVPEAPRSIESRQPSSLHRISSQSQRVPEPRLYQTTPLDHQSRPQPLSSSMPAPPTPPVARQQRPILPYVFQPSSVPQTPMETTLAAPLITKGQARSGTAVYPKYSPVTTNTAEGLYTLTDSQVYWDSRGRPQCFKVGCDNNQGIGYSTDVSRDEHITNTRYQSQVPHLGFEQTKRGYQNERDYPLL
ncbi:hypothetical protein KCU65_g5681, partial [Aureobasidium melanogenum]